MTKEPPIKGITLAENPFIRMGAQIKTAWAKNARLLYQLGQDTEARFEILSSDANDHQQFALLFETEAYRTAWERAYPFASTALQKNHLKIDPRLRAYYSMPWSSTVKSAAIRNGLVNHFIFAIAHTETGFDKDAQSHRGAMGLMQLMPKDASEIGAQIGKSIQSTDDLFDPRLSIALGSALLGDRKKKFQKYYLTAASYNASPNSVDEWIASFGNLEPLLFIERIPYQETRKYVKSVLVTWAMYDALAGKNLELSFN